MVSFTSPLRLINEFRSSREQFTSAKNRLGFSHVLFKIFIGLRHTFIRILIVIIGLHFSITFVALDPLLRQRNKFCWYLNFMAIITELYFQLFIISQENVKNVTCSNTTISKRDINYILHEKSMFYFQNLL